MRHKSADPEWVREHVQRYRDLRPSFKRFAELLQDALEAAAGELAPEAIVMTRAKTIASVAGKIQRQREQLGDDDPIGALTDLCGGRVIVHTPEEVKAVSDFIEGSFEVDRENSQDVSQRLKPEQFGYRSVHYIVSFPSETFSAHGAELEIPEGVRDLKGEIQVRTLLEHAWADFSHDRFYKGDFEVPDRWKRELAAVAATLWSADRAFSRIHDALLAYASSYGAYMSEEEIDAEIEVLETVLGYDPDNAGLAARIGKRAIIRENFEKAIEVLTPYADSGHHEVLRDLGVAMCKKHGKRKGSDEYRQGQRYLELAVESPAQDVDALCSLAGSWRGIAGGEEKVREYYRRGFELDPTDPYPAANYLEREVISRRDPEFALGLRPVIEAAIERCRLQAEVGVNMPWAHSDRGKFHLLLGRPYEGLAGYAKAAALGSAEYMVKPSEDSLFTHEFALRGIAGLEWVRRLRLLARATKFGSKEAMEELSRLASDGDPDIEGPVVILAGGTDDPVEEQIQAYRERLFEAFRNFRGTLISGGTRHGVSGLAGDLGEEYPEIRVIGYLPSRTPAGSIDDSFPDRYRQLRRTRAEDEPPSQGFSPLQPLQGWIDLVASGVDPREVRLLGINGGRITAAEFRVALALGAWVGLVRGSGRAAAELFTDEDWKDSPRLRSLRDRRSLRRFVAAGKAPAAVA